MLTWMSATLNGFIRPLKHNDFQEDAGRKNRVIRHGSIHDPGIQQEPQQDVLPAVFLSPLPLGEG